MLDESGTTPKSSPNVGITGAFPATQWSLLLQGGGAKTDAEARAGWEQLARSYWQPLYVFLRKRGLDHHTASDDIQGFFAHLLSRNFLLKIERGDGLFRSFLLAALKNWRTDQYRATTAKKRGDGLRPLPLDELEAAGAVSIEEGGSPEDALDRRWARAVYDNALTALQGQLKSRGREPLFLKLAGVFTGADVAKYEEIGGDLGMSVGAVKQSALELRREFGTILRREVRRTVTEDTQVDSEIRYLLGLLRD